MTARSYDQGRSDFRRFLKPGDRISFQHLWDYCNRNDSVDPGFNLILNGREQSIQTAHCTHRQMMQITGMALSIWRFVESTRENIDIFTYDDARIVPEQLFDYEPLLPTYPGERVEGQLWVTPKGLRREQFVTQLANEGI